MKYLLLLSSLVFISCATEQKKDVSPSSSHPNGRVESTADAAMAGRLDFLSSPNLTEAQKNRFMHLINQTQSKVGQIRQKEGDLKASLFRSLASGKYNKKEMHAYKKQLRKLESEKMDLMFSSLDEAQNILGVNREFNPEMLRDIYNHSGFGDPQIR